VDHVVTHTGQNYDPELNEVFFSELGLAPPHHLLETDTSSLGRMLGTVLAGAEAVLRQERPDAVLILGDTNSALAAIIAKRLRIPVYHMEAGNRCFDANVPEELNRRIVDHISDFNLVYTEHARRHLLSEGLPHRRIYLTGSPMKEVLDHYADGIAGSPALEELGLEPGGYLLASLHREENVDVSAHLRQLLVALDRLAAHFGVPVLVSTHPRTRDRLGRLPSGTPGANIRFAKPFGFFAYNKLQQHARCVISDSGTVSEESALLGFPAVTVRNAMERPEGLDTGTLIVTGLDPDVIVGAADAVVRQWASGLVPPIPADYQVANVSQRVVNLILGTAKLSHVWDNVVRPDL
jgi:UDP-N-acetylglucosamine 2-epimerase (non-hydrolysing)